MIHIFGHRPSERAGEFRTKGEALDYLRHDLPCSEGFRYRTNYQRRHANSIIFAFDGEVLSELVVGNCGPATVVDKEAYHEATWVYEISKVRIFKRPVRAAAVGLPRYHRGKQVPEPVYLRILELTGGFEEIEPSPLNAGQGFGELNENVLVERAAITFVKKQYESRNWRVTSVEETKCGYDLICRNDEEEHHVEVKGVSGVEPRFIITANEVNSANSDGHFRLSIVTSALSDPSLVSYTGAEFLLRFTLAPLQYSASLRQEVDTGDSSSRD